MKACCAGRPSGGGDRRSPRAPRAAGRSAAWGEPARSAGGSASGLLAAMALTECEVGDRVLVQEADGTTAAATVLRVTAGAPVQLEFAAEPNLPAEFGPAAQPQPLRRPTVWPAVWPAAGQPLAGRPAAQPAVSE